MSQYQLNKLLRSYFMEFILFRLLQLVRREINIFESLRLCLAQQRELIAEGNANNVVNMIDDGRHLLNQIAMIERDKQEEMTELASFLKIRPENLSLSRILKHIDSNDNDSVQLIIELKNELIKLLEEKRNKANKNKRFSLDASRGSKPKIRVIEQINNFILLTANDLAFDSEKQQPEIKIVDA